MYCDGSVELSSVRKKPRLLTSGTRSTLMGRIVAFVSLSSDAPDRNRARRLQRGGLRERVATSPGALLAILLEPAPRKR